MRLMCSVSGSTIKKVTSYWTETPERPVGNGISDPRTIRLSPHSRLKSVWCPNRPLFILPYFYGERNDLSQVNTIEVQLHVLGNVIGATLLNDALGRVRRRLS
jgi:hypothetical protein